MTATKPTTETHNFQVLYVGQCDGYDMYAVCRAERGAVRVVSSWFKNPAAANALAREWAERDGVQWFGR